MIQINDLSVSYSSKNGVIEALGPINLEVDAGEICAIIGPSGCGKSTLLNVLSGIIQNYEGKVLLNKKELNPLSHKIGFIPQNFGLLPWKTVQNNCLLPFKIKKVKITPEIIDHMNSIMKRLNILDLKDRYPGQLSGGQKQRTSILRGFLIEPDLLLMDEPFSALDAIIREEAQELFLDLWNNDKRTTFFVTHSIDEALYMGKKIVILSNHPGTIVDVIKNPLFNDKNFKKSPEYIKLLTQIKNHIKKGWE